MILNANAFHFSAQTCKQYNLGPSWYCEAETQESPFTTAAEIMQRQIEPSQKAELLNQLWEVQQKRAVITGAKQDLENVLVTQNYIAGLGTDFARNMVKLINSDPRYSMETSYYKSIADEIIDHANIDSVLRESSKRYAIAFIYSADCPYCKRQLPILTSLRSKIGMRIIGISADGVNYQGLDEVIVDESVATDPTIRSFPTMMLLDSGSQGSGSVAEKRIFVAKGLTTQDRLEKLIYTRILENENGTK
jgi:conjugal transfer pilus assembly protein TraF